MSIYGKPVLFRLSPQGRRALRGLVSKKGSFQAFVVQTDNVGAWVLMSGKQADQPNQAVPVMLLKWDYVAAAVCEFQPERPAVRERIGFV